MAAIEQLGDDQSFVTSGAFNHDQAGAWRRQLEEQFVDAAPIVANGADLGVGGQREIERGLGDIDSNRAESVHESIPSLRMRTRVSRWTLSVRAAVRVQFMGLAAIPLGYGVRVSEGKTIYGQPLVLGGTHSGTSPVQVVSLAIIADLASGVGVHFGHVVLPWRNFRRRGTGCSATSRWRSPALRSPFHGGSHAQFWLRFLLLRMNIQGSGASSPAV